MMEQTTPLKSAAGYGITVTPLERKGSFLSRARITVRVNTSEVRSEPTVVHVTFPKGEDTYLEVPEGREQWSFTWPDQLVGQLTRPVSNTPAVALAGPYTVVIVRGSVLGCNGFLGDVKGRGEA
ncbi:hypothetical protein K7B10_06220 [Streptomyces flavotricini]|uniref:Uncharacterized protein n=1 Tax=Streptomyces flavotricini TaxID=66888 RepID=A0ABS8DZT5_9ACTN|nr:hypothetical protein [Streptomyces flavotricini]MCC0094392.1 hypothetical protein [Streptomyces flavotricini]